MEFKVLAAAYTYLSIQQLPQALLESYHPWECFLCHKKFQQPKKVKNENKLMLITQCK